LINLLFTAIQHAPAGEKVTIKWEKIFPDRARGIKAMTRNASLYDLCDQPILEGECLTRPAAIFGSYTKNWPAILP
jgi:hypothetical protein